MIALPIYVLHGIEWRLNARAVARVRHDVDVEASAHLGAADVLSCHAQGEQHFGQAELVCVVPGQEEQYVDGYFGAIVDTIVEVFVS